MNKLIYILIIVFSLISFGNSKFSGERLERSCTLFIKKFHREAKVELLGNISDYKFEESGVRATFEFDGKTYGNTFLKLIFKHNNSIIKTSKIPVKIEIYLNVPVFSKNLRSGDVLTKSDIKYEKRFIDKNVITDAKALIGTKLTRSVGSGNIIYPELFEQVPVVTRGTDVIVMVYSGKVLIKASGEALNDATPGEKVRVKKKNSQLVIEGIANADGSVIIR
jgi:flagella basal body P-ring formation protein FlgA